MALFIGGYVCEGKALLVGLLSGFFKRDLHGFQFLELVGGILLVWGL